MNKVINLPLMVKKYNMDIRGVVHIGANRGKENRVYKALDIKNRIFFEPEGTAFRWLRKHLGKYYPVYQLALGNENKKVLLNVDIENAGMSSSILKPTGHLTAYPQIHFGKQEMVRMMRLDDVGLDLTNYNLIVIDVQGYELEVFRGALKSLEHIDYIMAEINREELYENYTQVGELTEFLSQQGFDKVEEVWVASGWGDGLFIKRKHEII